MLSVFVEVGKR